MTLRIYLPLGLAAGISFTSAYQAISWLAWVPNLLLAEWWVRRTRTPVPFGAQQPHAASGAFS